MAVLSIRVSGRLVMRYGVRRPLAAGLLLAAAGLALFSQAPASGDYLTVVLPGMALLGIGDDTSSSEKATAGLPRPAPQTAPTGVAAIELALAHRTREQVEHALGRHLEQPLVAEFAALP